MMQTVSEVSDAAEGINTCCKFRCYVDDVDNSFDDVDDVKDITEVDAMMPSLVSVTSMVLSMPLTSMKPMTWISP